MKIERPTVRKVKLYCEDCNNVNKFYFTNKEIYMKVSVTAICFNCNELKRFNMKNED